MANKDPRFCCGRPGEALFREYQGEIEEEDKAGGGEDEETGEQETEEAG